MGWLDFFKKHGDALLKGAGQGLQASQNNDGIGANIGNALGQMATNKIVGHFNQGEKEDTPVTTTGGQIDTNISYRPTEPLPPKPASDWQSVLSGMNGQQEQTQPVTWQTYLSQQAGAQPEANTMFANVGDPLKKNIALPPYNQARTNVMEVANRPIENKDKGFKGWLKEFASNIGTGMQNAQKNNPNGGFLENLGSALGNATVGGTLDRTQNETRNKEKDLAKAMQTYGIQNQITDDALGHTTKLAQIDNIYNDNEQKRRDSADRKDYDNRKLLADTEESKTRQQTQSLTNLNRLKYFDPHNPTHAALAKSAGLSPENLKGWDDRSPITKTVAGTVYKFNREVGNFEPTDLVDKSKSLVDFVVTSEDGQRHIYKVPEEKAANFQNQQSMLGKKVELAQALQANQQRFTAGENEKNRQAATQRQQEGFTKSKEFIELRARLKRQYDKPTYIQKAVDSWTKNYMSTSGRLPTEEEVKAYRQAVAADYDSPD